MKPSILLQLFGEFQLTVNSKVVNGLTSEKIQALVAYLAIEHNTPHSREFLAELLWPERPDGVARQNLRQALSRLQRILPAGNESLLQINRSDICLQRADHIEIDVMQFLTLLDATRAHAHDALVDCIDCNHRLVTAVELYRDDFLVSCYINSPTFEEWRLRKEELLRSEMLQALDLLVQHFEARQQWRSAYTYAWRSIEVDSLREVAHQQVMRALACLGRRNAAIEHYGTLAQLLRAELGVEPSATTMALHDALRTQQFETVPIMGANAASPNPLVMPSHNLPVQHTPFVGRQLELIRIAERMAQPECHLLTLIGPGGAGKTRLALEVATQQLQGAPYVYPDGIYFITLNTIEDDEQLIAVVAAAIACHLPDGSEKMKERQDALLAHLHTKRLLLILDNYEHIVDHRDLVLAIITEAPTVQLLITSRVPLHLRAEWLFDIAGLSYPTAEDLVLDPLSALPHPLATETLAAFEAVQFFCRAAQRVLADFSFSVEMMSAIGRLCLLTQGLPLALELAAAQIRQVPLPLLVETVQQTMDSLATTMRDVPERHRSLRAVFAHSWGLLPPPLQADFRRLAMFRGTFTGEAARIVVGCTHDALRQLVAYSLLRCDTVELQAPRYALHEVLREYALEQLHAAPTEEQQTRQRHGNYYLASVVAQHEAIMGMDAPQAIAALQHDIANIRAGWQWAADTQQLALIDATIAPLLRYFVMTGQSEEGGHWVDYALRYAAQWIVASSEFTTKEWVAIQHLCAGLHVMRARLFHKQARYRAAIDHAEQALAIAVASNAAHAAASALMYWGICLVNMGEGEKAETKLHQSLAWAKQDANEQVECDVLRTLGILAGQRNDLAAARQYYTASLIISQRIGHLRGTGASLGNLGLICRQLGDFDASRRLLAESLAIHRQIGDRSSEGRTLTMLGELSLELEEYVEAEAYCRNAIQLLRALSEEQYIADTLTVLGKLCLRQNQPEQAQMYWEEAAMIYDATQEQPLLEEVRQYLHELKVYRKNNAMSFDTNNTP